MHSLGSAQNTQDYPTQLAVHVTVYFARLLAHTFFISSLFFSARRCVPNCNNNSTACSHSNDKRR